ncbi:MAG: PAS domain S-box protein [Microcoleus sp. PH2017_10_PVI_O_A]|uniref:PAS domain S-box protein n=1 Tax=unclassified Microcoleus TaxID=2642155 RepID=UPI001D311A9A|nr:MULTISPECIES: PAS domain S-box protein [unclassified Microcoleus]TAE77844.1 MAG: PAS domain-containing sensor histidine kinase [Oscillatoriales cyanobacterium]MCC3407564.1 PAS domain S-box protein [Microcoleus sp. PH2017_10_PVI_O_A]MCC3461739.1 PAS domain S-box protein [Microcoleus sp. PH2017_11_PCY_U_A]MCC3481510.1 PAS domain S-box protein [Microcoleus sp. PH2017_12_PCY_D_A]MCC3529200.1 PAS domain S-box protein [Microcoleus sp. PH2017_21_RUC_O_A]
MSFHEAHPENKLSNISSTQKTIAKNTIERINYQELPKKLAENSAEANISEAYLVNLCEIQQMQEAIEQLEQDLKASESRFRNAIAKNADGIAIVNKQGLVCFANPSAEALFNCKAEELLGQAFFGNLVVEGSACDIEMDTDIIPQVGETEAAGMRVVQTEVAAIRKHKANAVVEMRVVETEWEGEMAYLATLRDVTDRKRAEEMLWLYDRAMAATSTGVTIFDATNPEHPIIYCNPAFESMTGYRRAEIIGKNCRFLQGSDTDSEALEIIRQALQTESECKVILKNYRKDGTAFWNCFSISPVRDRTGKLTHFIGIQRDITDRKKAEEALRNSEAQSREQAVQLAAALDELKNTHSQLIQSEKMSSLGLLIAGVAHEINNPVSFIHGNLAYLKDYTQDLFHLLELYQQHYPNPVAEIQQETEENDLDFLAEDLPRIVSSMSVGVERICQIVQSLRNFARHDDSQMKPVNLHEGIDSTLLILNHRLKGNGEKPPIQIVKEYGNLPLVECFAGPLNQVFMNILSNAIDALDDANSKQTFQEMPENFRQIRICTEVVGNFVEIKIADTGPGITEEVQQRIFDTFFTTKPVGKGTGMGLSISYQIIVEKHKGELYCTSELGKGTEFIIKMPIAH